MHCVICKKVQGKSFSKAQVGELPSIKSTQARPFETTGVDFAGALYVKQDGKSNKTYVVIFSCAVMRGIHLALVKDLSTNTFKNELKKFIARRGAPSLMINNNAKTLRLLQNGSRKWSEVKSCKEFGEPPDRMEIQPSSHTLVGWIL